jgi:diguanylate cyclase (GGDEF)-like protein/PAS domain S-box-containing protein
MIFYKNLSRRILVVDDNVAIREDFMKVLATRSVKDAQLKDKAARLFGRELPAKAPEIEYRINVVTRGQEGLECVREAQDQNDPYFLVFVDMRMPNGWNGIETTQRMWQCDPQLHIVLCTAFSDFSLTEIREQLSNSDRFLILKKPFDNIEVQQIADSLTTKALSERLQRETDRELRGRIEQLRLLESTVMYVNDGVWVTDVDLINGPNVIFANAALSKMSGATREQLLGQRPPLLNFGQLEPAVLAVVTLALNEQKPVSVELLTHSNSQLPKWIALDIVPLFNEHAVCTNFVGVQRDISLQKQATHKIEQLAFSDALTGLANRRALTDRLDQALTACLHEPSYCALIYVDLDNFKNVNDAFGHQQGDQFLIEVSQRLLSCVRADETVARIGGDEFVVILRNLDSDQALSVTKALAAVQRILELLSTPIVLQGTAYTSSASAGVMLFGDRQTTADILLQNADLAMYQAKAQGKETYRFFDTKMQASLDDRFLMANELRHAIQGKQLNLLFQPQLDTKLKVTGAEALLRWDNPIYGNISPGQFVPLAEKIGFIKQLGGWVLQQSCIELARWAQLAHMQELKLAVNISPMQFQQPDFTETVLSALLASGANPERLKLELTESMLITDLADVNRKIDALKDIGIAVSLDDFGTGYSSLNYLKRLSLDQLKIDQSFVRDMLTDSHGAAIARTIVTLGHSLDLEVIAEGVETLEQHQFLLGIGCSAFQGYWYSPPISAYDFETFVRLRVC